MGVPGGSDRPDPLLHPAQDQLRGSGRPLLADCRPQDGCCCRTSAATSSCCCSQAGCSQGSRFKQQQQPGVPGGSDRPDPLLHPAQDQLRGSGRPLLADCRPQDGCCCRTSAAASSCCCSQAGCSQGSRFKQQQQPGVPGGSDRPDPLLHPAPDQLCRSGHPLFPDRRPQDGCCCRTSAAASSRCCSQADCSQASSRSGRTFFAQSGADLLVARQPRRRVRQRGDECEVRDAPVPV